MKEKEPKYLKEKERWGGDPTGILHSSKRKNWKKDLGLRKREDPYKGNVRAGIKGS